MDRPIYLKIKDQIYSEIQNKASNEAIESERDLAKRLQASRMTVRKALDELVEEGYIYREKNKGTFVADKSLWKTNTGILSQNDEDLDYRLINFDVKYTVESAILENLNLSTTKPYSVIRAVRLVLRKQKPQKIEEFYILRNYIDEKNINKFDKLLDLNSYLDNSTMKQKFHPMTVPIKYATTLKLRINQPIIMVEGIIINKNGIPFIYYRSYNHPEEQKIEITI